MQRFIKSVVFVFVAAFLVSASAYAAEKVVVEGVISEISLDDTYIVVEGQKIATDSDFIAYYEVQVDDAVRITAEKTAKGLKAVDSEFLYIEEEVIENDGVIEDQEEYPQDEEVSEEPEDK